MVPRRYQLTLEPDLVDANFTGRELVEVEVTQPVKEIVVNAAELTIHRAVLRRDSGELEAEVVLDEEAEWATFRLPDKAEAGEWSLDVAFDGVLNDQLRGFYRSTFRGEQGEEQIIATTQFQATDARRAFPCWDEPDFKAVFSVTLVVPATLLAISNGREVWREPVGEGKVAVRYADTMPMSTYLVAFVVGPLEATDAVEVDGIPLRIICPRGKGHLSGFALEVGAFCLRWFADYYDIPYPGDKLDLIAIPDFAFGAMENMGAVTFREAALLVDPATATQLELSQVADVVGHELAHMWFGNLVTMKWWDGTWLNEAFATFMEIKASETYRPEWKRWLAFASDPGSGKSESMEIDALEATRPVEFPVASSAEANEMFDSLTYGKGGALLRMLEKFLGEDVFRDGIRHYLRRHSHANTETTDLWRALESMTSHPVGEIMDTFIHQGGYPQVELQATDGGHRLSQHRFRYLPHPGDPTTWKVPVLLRDGDEVLRVVLWEALSVKGRPELVANAGGWGFYRVGYADLQRLLDQFDRLDPLERYVLLDDTWAFTLAGQVPVSTYLDLLAHYREETEFAHWQLQVRSLHELHSVLDGETCSAFEAHTRRHLEAVAARLGWDSSPDEDDLTRRLRGLVLTALGTFAGNEGTVARARELKEEVDATHAALDPDVARAVISVVAAHGSTDDYRQYFERYRAAPTPQEERRYLAALSDFPQPDLAQRTFEATLDGSIRSADGPHTLARLLANREAGSSVWMLVKENWGRIVERFPVTIMRHAVQTLPFLSRPDLAADVEEFFATHEVPNAQKAVHQKLELLRVKVALREREADRLRNYLD